MRIMDDSFIFRHTSLEESIKNRELIRSNRCLKI